MASKLNSALILIHIFHLGSWKFHFLTVSAQSCTDVTDSIKDIISLPENLPAGKQHMRASILLRFYVEDQLLFAELLFCEFSNLSKL
ncbi:hypothetical protein CHS0354_033262 [Potamilus streckersoni]|uniref:Uncharacterized protein n=1 Tax=Potamilus streckersoni TaxID=2493646 RepID=A0AAE0VPU2_9BIVA|nr:hypothetical protein CHS0354_033262 [Potamilus streckersoni]